MPIESIVVITGIICAFGLFGVVLAWGERRTRRLPIPSPPLEIPGRVAAGHATEPSVKLWQLLMM